MTHGLQGICCYLYSRKLDALESVCVNSVKQISANLTVRRYGMLQQGSEWWGLAFLFATLRLWNGNSPSELFHVLCTVIIALVAGTRGSFVLVEHPKQKANVSAESIAWMKGVLMPRDESPVTGGSHRRITTDYAMIDLVPPKTVGFVNPDVSSDLKEANNWSAVSYAWREFEGGIAFDDVRSAIANLRNHLVAMESGVDPELTASLSLPWFIDHASCSHLSSDKEEDNGLVVKSADVAFGSSNCKAHLYITRDLQFLAHHRQTTQHKLTAIIVASFLVMHLTDWRWALPLSPLFFLLIHIFICREGAKVPAALFGIGWSRCWVRRELMLSLPMRPTYVVSPHHDVAIRVTACSPAISHFRWCLKFLFDSDWMANISIPAHKIHGYWNYDSFDIRDNLCALSKELGVNEVELESMNAPWFFMKNPHAKLPGQRLLLPGRLLAPHITGGLVIHTPGPLQATVLANTTPSNFLDGYFGDVQSSCTARHLCHAEYLKNLLRRDRDRTNNEKLD